MKNQKCKKRKKKSDDSFNKGKRCGATNLWRQIFFFIFFSFKIFQGITSMKAFNMLMKLCTYLLLTVVTRYTFE